MLQKLLAFYEMPESLAGQDVHFTFESPLQAAMDRKDGVRFREAIELGAIGAQVDPALASHIDAHTAFRDALKGIGVNPNWMRDPKDAAAHAEQQAQMMAASAA